ncbi:hypothetical protein M378DRAFT_461883 [Amanita muscaria Koide BX008]|uniref:Uncharacterized protein n=1 Tax=Amanita muscaria (strain Koide BX008) TaxID=946122 RepID=A0A0C2SR60_AMAMK|nr:hypothetical protein M378DRAFT_461883 [Amanita muscaria Koide BX008]
MSCRAVLLFLQTPWFQYQRQPLLQSQNVGSVTDSYGEGTDGTLCSVLYSLFDLIVPPQRSGRYVYRQKVQISPSFVVLSGLPALQHHLKDLALPIETQPFS